MNTTSNTAVTPNTEVVEPSMGELRGWVSEWLGIIERRATNGRRWCARWDEHPEAVCRLRLLMLTHRRVVASGDPLVMSAWLLDHLDRHLDALQRHDGPFTSCGHDYHRPGPHLRAEPIDYARGLRRRMAAP